MAKGNRTMTQHKFIRKYFQYPSGRREWCVTADFGSLSFWVSGDDKESYGLYGGVESHYNEKSKPDYLSEGAFNERCECNAGKCWHDGTSLWASEYWIPSVLPEGQEFIWRMLEHHYDLKHKGADDV